MRQIAQEKIIMAHSIDVKTMETPVFKFNGNTDIALTETENQHIATKTCDEINKHHNQDTNNAEREKMILIC